MTTVPRPKSVALMVILGALLTGTVIGVAVGRSMPREDRDPGAELARELSLTPAQQQLFDSVYAWRRQQSRRIMGSVRPALDSVRDSARVLLFASLDSSQQVAFRALIERNRRTADSAERNRTAR